MVEGRSADLLRGHKAIDDIINVPRGWLKSPRFVWQLRGQLRRQRYDFTIDMQGLTKSALVAWMAGAKRRIGFSGWEGRELSTWLNNELVAAQTTHVIDRNLELLRPLGITAPIVRFDLPETGADRAAAERVVAESPPGSGFAVINPGAGWPSKWWPRDRFAAVARYRTLTTPSLVVGRFTRAGLGRNCRQLKRARGWPRPR
jgi:ADP-heptose:LPS heptosyltransferase